MTLNLIKQTSFEGSDDILKGLNPPQAEAVQHIKGPLLIIAGAGSGKTRVLTNRIAYMLEHGIAPYNILALTFTNKAAGEMKQRIAKMVSPEKSEKIWAGTFHSVFAKILRIEAEKIGFTSSFSIYDTDDSLSLIKNAMQSLQIQPSAIPPQLVRSKISKAKNDLKDSKKMMEEAGFGQDKIIAQIYEQYERKLKEANSMDFDDLLIYFIRLLSSNPEVLAKYQDKFQYIMVDEYQDTNRAQYLAVNMLSKQRQNLCVVGDDAQSIYKWRGADIRNILDFQKDYPHAKVVRLEQNYRSTKNILAAADSVIKHNTGQLPKSLWTDNPEGSKIALYECADDRAEAMKVVKTIKDKITSKADLNSYAVLYRTNAQSMELENACRKADIPYVIIGGMSFYRRKEIKDAICYLKLLINPKDNEALLRVVNEPPRGIGQTSLNHIKQFADAHNLSLLEVFSNAAMISELKRAAINAAAAFSEMVAKFMDMKSVVPFPDLVIDYFNACGLVRMYEEIGTDESKEKIRNIEQLINDIGYFFQNNPDMTPEDYLQQVSLVTDADEKETGHGKLTLMTLHSAKGLEFNNVYLVGLEKGLFPMVRNDYDDDEIEEERRLFYVGITRAEQNLTLTYCRQRMRFGQISMQAPSLFLKEIDENLLDHDGQSENPFMQKFLEKNPDAAHLVRNSFSSEVSPYASSGRPVRVGFKKPEPKRSAQSSNKFNDIPQQDYYSQMPEPKQEFKVGDTVKHNQFGVGRVTGLSGVGSQRKITVLFPVIGKKQLMLGFAKLELVR